MKNTKLFSALLKTLIISVSALTAMPAFSADSPLAQGPIQSDDKSAINKIKCESGIDCLIAGNAGQYRAYLFYPTYHQDITMNVGSILETILSPPEAISLSEKSNTAQSLLILVANKGDVADNFLQNTPAIFAPNKTLPASTVSMFGVPSPLPPSTENTKIALNTMNFNSVIAPITYKVNSNKSTQFDEADTANAFIQYVTGLVNPMRTADFTNIKMPADFKGTESQYLLKLQQKPDVRDYLTGLRTYTSQVSVGLSNLYYLYNERMPITDKTKLDQLKMSAAGPFLPGLTDGKSEQVSPLQVEQYLANRRVNDAEWYKAMQQALPSTILREALFILAEIPPMLFQLHLDLERVTATLSVMQLQQTNNSRLMLEQSRDNVESILQNPEQAQTQTEQATDEARQKLNKEEQQQTQKLLEQQQKQ